MCVQSVIDFLNSNFSTAMFGAIFGSLTIILIEWLRSQNKILADINASIAVLSGALNTYLMIKRQHSMPVALNYAHNIAILAKQPDTRVQLHLKKFGCPDLQVSLPMDRIFTLAHKHSAVIPLLMQAKRVAADVESACRIWNDMTDFFREMPEEERESFYRGLKSESGVQDAGFSDAVKNLETCVDDALFFTNLAIEGLSKVGKKALPFWLKSEVSKVEIVGEDHKVLMPPPGYRGDWNLNNI